MWMTIISLVLQLVLEFVKWKFKDNPTVAAQVNAAYEEAKRTKSARPLRDLLDRLKAATP